MRALAAVALLLTLASAQDVHVQPRPKPAPPSQPPTPRQLVSNVEVVLVPVTVTDPMTRIVTGLEKQHFQVFEDNQPQEIRYFHTQDEPISLGIILDASNSMKSVMDASRGAVKEFMDAAHKDDEFFLITFNTEPKLTEGFTQDEGEIDNQLIYQVSKGRTALCDAVYLGLQKIHGAKYPRRALLVISDGGENNSRYSTSEVQRVMREADVQIYTVGIRGRDYNPWLLDLMAKTSGGRFFTGLNRDTIDKIAVSLRSEYVLGYRPSNLARDGRYRRIKVKVVPPRGLPQLHIAAKQGYYAPEK